MPARVNGCGTWYFGRKNVDERAGVCEACGGRALLTSYDTRLVITIAFIPLIPLGRKRIIEECSACRRHRAMALSDWEAVRQRAAESVEAYCNSPLDAELACESLRTCLAFRDAPAFEKAAAEVERRLAGDDETLMLAAAGYADFARFQDAERMARLALAAKDDDEIREFVAECLLQQNRPADAAPFCDHIVQKGLSDRADLLYRLGQNWQIQGEHEQALAVFDQCAATAPTIAASPDFERLREASESRLGTRRTVKPQEVLKQARRKAALGRFKLIAPLVVGLALAAYGVVAWCQGAVRAVYVVNGVDVSYDVLLNGERHRLAPNSVTKVRLGEGEATVEIVDSLLPIEPETTIIRTDFFTRPFKKATLVINPDRSALLERQRVFYGDWRSSSDGPEPESEFFGGKTFYEFDGVDYPFERFPKEITLSSHDDVVPRVGLSVVDVGDDCLPSVLIWGLTELIGADAVSEAARTRLSLQPEEVELLAIARAGMTPEKFLAFVRGGLRKRPLLVNWHRRYQDTMEAMGREQESQREYEELLAAEPDNSDLMYLAARATLNTERARALCERAAVGETPSAYAHHWLAMHDLACGRFEQAAPHAEEALRLAPNDFSLWVNASLALIAAKRFERVLELSSGWDATPQRLFLGGNHLTAYAYGQMGKPEEAKEAIRSVAQRIAGVEPDGLAEFCLRPEAELAYATGDVDAFVTALKASSEKGDRLAALLTQGDARAADAELADVEEVNADTHLLVYLAASMAGESEIADRHLAAAAETLCEGSAEERMFGEALRSDPGARLAEVLNCCVLPQEKATRLAAIGWRHPGTREQCFELARKLNFDRRYPHQLLERALTENATPAEH